MENFKIKLNYKLNIFLGLVTSVEVQLVQSFLPRPTELSLPFILYLVLQHLSMENVGLNNILVLGDLRVWLSWSFLSPITCIKVLWVVSGLELNQFKAQPLHAPSFVPYILGRGFAGWGVSIRDAVGAVGWMQNRRKKYCIWRCICSLYCKLSARIAWKKFEIYFWVIHCRLSEKQKGICTVDL